MTTLHRVTCPRCGRVTNYTNDLGPTDAEMLCGCEEESATDVSDHGLMRRAQALLDASERRRESMERRLREAEAERDRYKAALEKTEMHLKSASTLLRVGGEIGREHAKDHVAVRAERDRYRDVLRQVERLLTFYPNAHQLLNTVVRPVLEGKGDE